MQSKAVLWQQCRHWKHLFMSSSQLMVLSENTDRVKGTHYSRLLFETAHLITFCWDAVPWQTWFKTCRRDMKCASGCDSSPKSCCVPTVLILQVTGVCLGYFSLVTNPWPSGQNLESENVLKLRNFRILYTWCPSLPSVRVVSTMTNTRKQPGEERV